MTASPQLDYWIMQIVAILITVALIPKLRLTGLMGAVFTILAITLVNAYLWDAALFFALPNSLTLHAALLLLANGIIFYVLVKLLPGIEVEGVTPALIAPVIFTLTSIVLKNYSGQIDWATVFEVLSSYTVWVFDNLKHFFGK